MALKKVVAQDLRREADFNATITVEFDDTDIVTFDLRGETGMMSCDTWGRKVQTSLGTLYLERHGYGIGRTVTERNTFYDR